MCILSSELLRCKRSTPGPADPMWTTNPRPQAGSAGEIASGLDWAPALGDRVGENAARWRGHLEEPLPKKTNVRAVEHDATLPYHERPRFMAELHRQHGVAARSLEFVIRTAARTGVVIGATAGNRSGAPPVGHSRQPNDGRWGGNTACPQQNRSRDPAVIV